MIYYSPLVNTSTPGLPDSPFWYMGINGGATEPKLIYFDADGSPTYTDLSTAAMTAANWSGLRNEWTACTLAGYDLFNVAASGTAPFYYDQVAGGATVTALTASGFPATTTTNAIRAYRDFAVAFGVNNLSGAQSQTLWWSDRWVPGAAPPTWTPAATNEAGSTDLSDAFGALVDGLSLGRSFIVYKQNSCYRMTYIGGPAVMQFENISRQAGCMARNCIARVGESHVVLTRDDVIMLNADGNIQSLARGKIRNEIFDSLDAATWDQSFVVYHPVREQVFVFTHDGSADIGNRNGWVLSLRDGAWAKWDPEVTGDNTWPTDYPTAGGMGPAGLETGSQAPEHRAVIAYPRGATTGTRTFLSMDDDGVAVGPGAGKAIELANNHLLRRNLIDFGEPDQRKLVRGVRLIGTFAASDAITVNVYARDGRDAAASLAATGTFTSGGDRVDLLADGRFFDLELTAAPDATILPPWRLEGFQVDVETRGRF